MDITPNTVFADDAIASASAAELAQRLQLVASLMEHPGINRRVIDVQLAECRELHAALGEYLATIDLPTEPTPYDPSSCYVEGCSWAGPRSARDEHVSRWHA